MEQIDFKNDDLQKHVQKTIVSKVSDTIEQEGKKQGFDFSPAMPLLNKVLMGGKPDKKEIFLTVVATLSKNAKPKHVWLSTLIGAFFFTTFITGLVVIIRELINLF